MSYVRASRKILHFCAVKSKQCSTPCRTYGLGPALWVARTELASLRPAEVTRRWQASPGSRTIRTSAILGGEVKVVQVPAFAESVSEGDVRFEKAAGDSVKEDEVVAEIETDKTSVPVPAPVAGVIHELLVADGSTVKPGTDLFSIEVGAGGGAAPSAPKKSEEPAAKPEPSAAPAEEIPKDVPAKEAPKPQAEPATAGPIPSRPPAPAATRPAAPSASIPVAAVRHSMALEKGEVKLPPADPTAEITGTRTEQRVKMSRMRQRIAQRLKDAQNTNAMLTTFNEIDMSNIMQLRKQHQEAFVKKHGIKIGFMSAFVKASAYALTYQPTVNAAIDGNEIVYRDYVDISVAVATPKGLVVPVLRSVEGMSYLDIEKGIEALGAKAKDGSLAVEDMDGGTFTISNGGVFGSMFGTPIINPPQAAILGMHGIFQRPVAIDGKVEIRPMMYVALTYDHRLIDGREAVTFLRHIKAAVEDPRVLLLGL
ncbi:dihydrolipoyllysine-residue succinyltransferase component of 2-oxoglutarate dehydrogenase complex, mitochondrial-like isoform X2 [Pollicipes pollicipes]|uniref:dihydrolipoyllysine-residue succinyltransferase component of 2-oxoglutarate dehydrogenase complex, mitochondrial-like isoform X2 n=1 Tax=Pollicipes pollicipes TaxID=41117 RepID=UPI0018852884|nr:dihydrolipoyllysine-residue succinyltransferase component of 2-oxoglutarate dehydrogenase complex, mitochondrial-like isoform X2 [Pollicipes pollicipes]